MINPLKIATRNANRLSPKYSQEMKTFIFSQNIDILLVFETHFSNKSYCHIPEYILYTMHPGNSKVHRRIVLIIRSDIKHDEIGKFQREFFQATSIDSSDRGMAVLLFQPHSPPKYTIKKEQYIIFFKTLGNRFIAVEDYNAKHMYWRSKLILSKGRELLKAIEAMNLATLSAGNPSTVHLTIRIRDLGLRYYQRHC